MQPGWLALSWGISSGRCCSDAPFSQRGRGSGPLEGQFCSVLGLRGAPPGLLPLLFAPSLMKINSLVSVSHNKVAGHQVWLLGWVL